MSLNPLLGKNAASNGEIVPLPLPNEIFLMRRSNVSICLSKSTGQSQALKGKGSIFLLSFRLVFVRSGNPNDHKDFNSIELPLALITNEHDSTKLPELRQPIFGCTQLVGRIHPNPTSQYPLREDVVWTLYFKKSCESFCGAFFHVMKNAKSLPENHLTRGSPVNANELLAFANPADPSEIYVTQPVLNQPCNFNNNTIYQEYNLENDQSRYSSNYTHSNGGLTGTSTVPENQRGLLFAQNRSPGRVEGRRENSPQGAPRYPPQEAPGYPPQQASRHPAQRAPGYPSQGATGYPPQEVPGQPPQGVPGYPPQGTSGYPPQGVPGYPPQGVPGYPPQGVPEYPSQEAPGYPLQGIPGYLPQGVPGYPPQGTPGYPPHGVPGYPPHGVPGYPPHGVPGYPSQGVSGYPPQGVPGYPPQGVPGYPPQGVPGYPPQGVPGYPPQGALRYPPR